MLARGRDKICHIAQNGEEGKLDFFPCREEGRIDREGERGHRAHGNEKEMAEEKGSGGPLIVADAQVGERRQSLGKSENARGGGRGGGGGWGVWGGGGGLGGCSIFSKGQTPRVGVKTSGLTASENRGDEASLYSSRCAN